MKRFTVLLAGLFFLAQLSCKKTEDPLAPYAKFGIFKDIYPLQDSLTIDLKKGEVTTIETNLGPLLIKNYRTINTCSEETRGYCDLGAYATLTFTLRDEEISIFYNSFSLGVSAVKDQKSALSSCSRITIPMGHRTFRDEFFAEDYSSIGNMNVQLRRIYPFAKDTKESDLFVATDQYHLVFTLLKTCR